MKKFIKITKGFSILELILSMVISSILVGGLVYVVSEANFFLNKQLYRGKVNRYGNAVMHEIFSTTINANFVNIENTDQIICGFRTNQSSLDSLKIYEHRRNDGVLINGKPIENLNFYSKDNNKNFYMEITDFQGKHTFDGQGYNADVRDAVIDILLGIKLHYTRGNKKIMEEFPFKKTIFTRYAAVYNSSKEIDE